MLQHLEISRYDNFLLLQEISPNKVVLLIRVFLMLNLRKFKNNFDFIILFIPF